MCRIFYNPNPDFSFKNEDSWKFFELLERIGGGSGNGFYIMKNKLLEKYAKLMPDWVNVEGEFIFHTRRATHGTITDFNAQPFVGKRYVLVHNGIFNREISPVAPFFGRKFIYQAAKYSDSYKMHKVMEEVGLMKFYLAFKKENYGVLIVHDKKLKKTFLLKTGGEFQCAKLDGSYIYGSSNLNFWKLDGDVTKFLYGLYRLEVDGFEKLDTIEKYAYQARGYYGGYVHTQTVKKKKKRKRNTKKNKNKTIKVKNLMLANATTSSTTDITVKPTGLQSLFPDTIIPNYCHGCDWVRKRQCWFNNVKQKDFYAYIDKDINIGTCHSEFSRLSKKYKETTKLNKKMEETKLCAICKNPFEDGSTKYFSGKDDIVCEGCHVLDGQKSNRRISLSCSVCFSKKENTWFHADKKIYCNVCYKKKFISKKKKIYNDARDSITRCVYCTHLFENDDEKYKDPYGNIICEACQNECEEAFKEEQKEEEELLVCTHPKNTCVNLEGGFCNTKLLSATCMYSKSFKEEERELDNKQPQKCYYCQRDFNDEEEMFEDDQTGEWMCEDCADFIEGENNKSSLKKIKQKITHRDNYDGWNYFM